MATSILFDEYYKLKDAYENSIKAQRFDILKQKKKKNKTKMKDKFLIFNSNKNNKGSDGFNDLSCYSRVDLPKRHVNASLPSFSCPFAFSVLMVSLKMSSLSP